MSTQGNSSVYKLARRLENLREIFKAEKPYLRDADQVSRFLMRAYQMESPLSVSRRWNSTVQRRQVAERILTKIEGTEQLPLDTLVRLATPIGGNRKRVLIGLGDSCAWEHGLMETQVLLALSMRSGFKFSYDTIFDAAPGCGWVSATPDQLADEAIKQFYEKYPGTLARLYTRSTDSIRAV